MSLSEVLLIHTQSNFFAYLLATFGNMPCHHSFHLLSPCHFTRYIKILENIQEFEKKNYKLTTCHKTWAWYRISNRPPVYLHLIFEISSVIPFFFNFKLKKKIDFETNLFFVEFQLDFYCLCSLQKSSSNSTKNRVCFEIDFFLSLKMKKNRVTLNIFLKI